MSRFTALAVAMILGLVASSSIRAEETAAVKKEATPAAAPAPTATAPKSQQIDDDTQKRLNDTLNKMSELDKQWASERNKTVKSSEMTKEDKKRMEERKKAEDKEAKDRRKSDGEKSAYRTSDSGVSGQYASNSSGGWVETGGVTSRSSYSSSASGGSVREGSSGGTSIGVRATVIRLE